VQEITGAKEELLCSILHGTMLGIMTGIELKTCIDYSATYNEGWRPTHSVKYYNMFR
jgi:hypothetical protein